MGYLLSNSTNNLLGNGMWLDWLGSAQSGPATPLLPFVPKHGESLDLRHLSWSLFEGMPDNF